MIYNLLVFQGEVSPDAERIGMLTPSGEWYNTTDVEDLRVMNVETRFYFDAVTTFINLEMPLHDGGQSSQPRMFLNILKYYNMVKTAIMHRESEIRESNK